MRAGELEELVPAARVRSRISELAEQMARDFDGAPFVIVRIDEGARRFASALEGQLGERGIAPEMVTSCGHRESQYMHVRQLQTASPVPLA